MTGNRVLLFCLIVLVSFSSTVQDQAWRADYSLPVHANHPPGHFAIKELITQMIPKRSLSPFDAGAGVGNQLLLDPIGDHVYSNVLNSPVTDSESDVPRTSSGGVQWAAGVPGMCLDDWHLPPAFNNAMEDEASIPGSEPVTEESTGSSEEGSSVRRRCHLCKLMDATRGVAEDNDSGRWVTLVCRNCSPFIKSTIALSTRCRGCRRYANFGPIGGSRRDARHCKRHRQPDEINLSRKRCDFFKSDLDRNTYCTDVPTVSFRGSNYCEWHARQSAVAQASDGRGRAPADKIYMLPSAQRKTPRQCIREGCHLTASFGDAHSGAILCSGHREPQHVDLIHKKRCEHRGCQRNPSYGLPSEGLARFCKEHRPGSYIDLRSRKCQYPYGCGKRPSFGDVSDGIARFCMGHKLPHHVNVKSRKCEEQGCGKQPTFGGSDDMQVRFCAVHRRPGDMDLVHARCRHHDCLKVALFSFKGESPQFCFAHRQEHMVNMNGLRAYARPRGAELSATAPTASTADAPQPLVCNLKGWGDEPRAIKVMPWASASSEHPVSVYASSPDVHPGHVSSSAATEAEADASGGDENVNLQDQLRPVLVAGELVRMGNEGLGAANRVIAATGP